jgi:cytochrome c oxidase subunit 2
LALQHALLVGIADERVEVVPVGVGEPIFPGILAQQLALLLKGKQGTAMASFKQLSDVELAAVATYTRNAWSNKAEDNIVQPKEFTEARK